MNLVDSLRRGLGRIRAWVGVRAREQPVIFWTTVLVVAVGLVLRARGYLFDRHGLGQDEATWAIMLMRDPLVSLLIRPIGFMSVAKLLALVFGPYEVVLRTQSWLAGMGVVLLALPLSKRLFRAPAAQLLFVAVLSLHPSAIDLAKEYKPYSVSLFVHLGLLLLVLRYLETQRARDLALALGGAFLGGFWTQDLVMAYPGVFLVLAWSERRGRWARLGWVSATVVAILGALLLQYLLIWSKLPADESSMWGRKYGVFFTGAGRQSYLAWWFDRYVDLAEFPGFRREYWSAEWLRDREINELAVADRWVWLALHVVGVTSLVVRRRFRFLLLLLLPFLVHAVFTAKGYWPGGVFRTNLFFLGYSAALAGMALDVPRGEVKRWFAVAPALVLVVLPLLLFEHGWHARKKSFAFDTDIPLVLEKLIRLEPPAPRGERVPLLVSRRTCDPYEYYITTHPDADRYRAPLAARYDWSCVSELKKTPTAISRTMRKNERAWLLVGGKNRDIKALAAKVPGIDFEPRFRVSPTVLVRLTHQSH